MFIVIHLIKNSEGKILDINLTFFINKTRADIFYDNLSLKSKEDHGVIMLSYFKDHSNISFKSFISNEKTANTGLIQKQIKY